MKELSLFLLKNSFGSKVKKGFKNFCNGENSTSTLDQHKFDQFGVIRDGPTTYMGPSPLTTSPSRETHPTLEEMIMQLEMEEKIARRAKKLDNNNIVHHRMSCVNSSDILRSARNALNQYPRFSLDGKDAMYRSSFTNLAPPIRGEKGKSVVLPAVVGGESVVWCKPGVVGKLMGLEAMPMPLNSSAYRRERLSAIIKRQNLRKRGEMERRRMAGTCSRTGYCVMKPVDLGISNDEAGWPIRRFI